MREETGATRLTSALCQERDPDTRVPQHQDRSSPLPTAESLSRVPAKGHSGALLEELCGPREPWDGRVHGDPRRGPVPFLRLVRLEQSFLKVLTHDISMTLSHVALRECTDCMCCFRKRACHSRRCLPWPRRFSSPSSPSCSCSPIGSKRKDKSHRLYISLFQGAATFNNKKMSFLSLVSHELQHQETTEVSY
jgi:hypothetical protein